MKKTLGQLRHSFALRLRSTLLAFPALLFVATRATAFGPVTHLEWSLSHTDLVGGAPLIVSNANAGEDGTTQVDDLVFVNATHGTHRVNLRADVASQSNGAPILHALGEHEYHLNGTNRSSDVWTLVDGDQLLRAALVDRLTVQGTPLGTFFLDFYWDLGGDDELVVDLTPGDSLYTAITTRVHLDARGATGSSTYEETIPGASGFVNNDINKAKSLDEYVKVTLSGTTGQAIDVDTTFEVEPDTLLNNFIEIPGSALIVDGHHSAFFDQSARLIGVVVRDSLGNILPFATIGSASGFSYPVLGAVPVAPLPAQTILSPVAVVGNSLGEFNASVAAVHMIDHSGLDKPFTSGVTGFDRYFDFSPTPYAQANFANNWQSLIQTTLPLTGQVDFDLGGNYWIDRLAIWNRSLENVRVQIASSPTGPWQDLGLYTLQNRIFYTFSYPVEILDLGGEFQARYVRLKIESAYKLRTTDTFAYAMVGELAVRAALSPVPEPGLCATAATGVLALTGAARRRARAGQSRVAGACALDAAVRHRVLDRIRKALSAHDESSALRVARELERRFSAASSGGAR